MQSLEPARLAANATKAPPGTGRPETTRQAALRLGPQRLAYDSLIHRKRKHRGAVATWEPGDDTRVRGFGVGTNTVREDPKWAGQAGDGYRLSGLLVEHTFRAPQKNAVKLRLGWVSGQESIDKKQVRRSAGWSVAGDADLLSDRLRLSAEYAASRVQSRASPVADQDADDAYRLGFELRAPAAAPLDWHLGSEFHEVDPGFSSLGNPSLPQDRAQFRTYGGASLGDWQLELDVLRYRQNLDRDPSRPVIVRDRVKAETTWSPMQPALSQIAGNPRYRLAAEIGRKRTTREGGGTNDGSERHRSLRLSLGSEFSRPELRWGMRAKAGMSPGKIGEVESPAVRALEVEMYADLGDGWGVPMKPALSWQRRRDAASDGADERWRAELTSPPIELRHDLRGAFDMTFEHRDRSDIDPAAPIMDLGAQLVWTLQRASPGRRGLTLAVAGGLASHGALSDDEDRYTLMVSLSTEDMLASW